MDVGDRLNILKSTSRWKKSPTSITIIKSPLVTHQHNVVTNILVAVFCSIPYTQDVFCRHLENYSNRESSILLLKPACRIFHRIWLLLKYFLLSSLQISMLLVVLLKCSLKPALFRKNPRFHQVAHLLMLTCPIQVVLDENQN